MKPTTLTLTILTAVLILAVCIATIFWQFGYRPEPAPTFTNIDLPTL